jgi:hypothetical protein
LNYYDIALVRETDQTKVVLLSFVE